MNLTSPDNIAYASTSDDLSVEDITAAMATSVQDALDDLVNDTRQRQTYRWADATARTAQAGMQAGDEGYQVDTATDYIYTGSTWRVNTGGLVLISKQTLAASASATFDSVFSSGFQKYRIDFHTVGSGNQNLSMVLRAGGVASATGYDTIANNATGAAGAPTATTSLNQANWVFSSTTLIHQGHIDLSAPADATFKTIGDFQDYATLDPATAAATTILTVHGISHRTAAAYDGFAITPSSGTMSGFVKVYGYV